MTRAWRTPAVVVAVALALFGSFLLALTPSLDDRPGLQTLWVIFSLVLLKVPLLALIGWIIVRRCARGGGPWSDEATTAFLRRTADEAAGVAGTPGAGPRLERLRAQTWAAIERSDGAHAPALVDLALRIEQLQKAAGRRPGGVTSP